MACERCGRRAGQAWAAQLMDSRWGSIAVRPRDLAWEREEPPVSADSRYVHVGMVNWLAPSRSLTGFDVFHAEITAIIDALAKLNPKALLGGDYHKGTVFDRPAPPFSTAVNSRCSARAIRMPGITLASYPFSRTLMNPLV